jgi:hypothetical protein
LREERRLRVFGNRVLRRIFWPKMDKVTEEWRKLHNEEHHDLYSSPTTVRVIKTRRMRRAGRGDRSGDGIGCVQSFGGTTGGKETTRETQA